jgi:hypothetical protein
MALSFFALSLEPILDYYLARVTIRLTMPGDVIEITPENDPRSRPQCTPFANQHAAILAEHSIQSNDQSLQRRSLGLSSWLAFAVASGAIIAFAFVYLLGR